MITHIGVFELHAVKAEMLDQMFGHFAAGAGKIRALFGMPPENVLYPEMRAEYRGQQQKDTDGSQKGD